MRVYQVLNSSGMPASNETNDLCVFEEYEDAVAHIEYLKTDIGIEDTFKVIVGELYMDENKEV